MRLSNDDMKKTEIRKGRSLINLRRWLKCCLSCSVKRRSLDTGDKHSKTEIQVYEAQIVVAKVTI